MEQQQERVQAGLSPHPPPAARPTGWRADWRAFAGEPPPTTAVYVDGVTWAVEGGPLSGTAAPHFFPHVDVLRTAPDVLEFVPTWRARVLVAIATAATAAAACVIVLLLSTIDGRTAREGAARAAASFVVGLAALVFVVLAVEHASLRLRFDRAAGVLTRRTSSSSSAMPLSGLIAVQCLYERCVEAKGGKVHYHQLNLVWKGPRAIRLNVWVTPEATQARALAGAVAEFLGVELVDQIDATKAYYDSRPGWWDHFQAWLRGMGWLPEEPRRR
jgi:hypothetical protein